MLADWAAHGVIAPNGRVRAAEVPTTQRISHFLAAKVCSVSRTMRLFPTPAAPLTTMPAESASRSAASMSRVSFERPVNGHVNRTH